MKQQDTALRGGAKEPVAMPSIAQQAALEYLRRGWAVLPIAPGTKRPLVPWEKYQHRHPTEAEVVGWWTRWPDAQVAIVTGAVSGLVVLDEDGPEAQEALRDKHLPATPTVRTSKGWHRYFRHPGFECRNFARKLPGLDFRGDGGYVLAPPSLHPSGRRYEWANTLSPDDVPLAPCPDWLLDLLRPVPSGEPIPKGQRNSTLVSLAGTMRRRGMTQQEIETALLAVNARRCVPPLPEEEVRAIARSVARYAPAEAKRPVPDSEKEAAIRREPVLVRVSDVEPEEVKWLWWPYIPRRKLTLVEGDPNMGKTWLCLTLAAIVSRGWPFPDPGRGVPEEGAVRSPESVLYMSAEDGIADTLRPRLDAAGADPSRIHVLTGWTATTEEGERLAGCVTLSDIPVLQAALEQVRPALVVIDPVQGFLGASVDMHRANEVRPVLARLTELAERYDCAIILVRHLSKAPSDRALYRGLGSIDFTAAARSILLVAEDPERPGEHGIIHLKSNLAAKGPAIGFKINNGRFEWAGLSRLSPAVLWIPELGAQERGSALQEAMDFLKAALEDGPKPAKELLKEAKKAGIEEITLRRAKKELGVQARRLSEPGAAKGSGAWVWELPAKTPTGDEGDQDGQKQLASSQTQDDHLDHLDEKPTAASDSGHSTKMIIDHLGSRGHEAHSANGFDQGDQDDHSECVSSGAAIDYLDREEGVVWDDPF
jgi:hypothetical protein